MRYGISGKNNNISSSPLLFWRSVYLLLELLHRRGVRLCYVGLSSCGAFLHNHHPVLATMLSTVRAEMAHADLRHSAFALQPGDCSA